MRFTCSRDACVAFTRPTRQSEDYHAGCPRRRRRRSYIISAAALALCVSIVGAKETLPPTLSKGHRILIENGLQIQGMAGADEPFHLQTYAALNYTAINWFANTNPKLMGPPPGVPWARWLQPKDVPPPASEMPPSEIERPYASKF